VLRPIGTLCCALAQLLYAFPRPCSTRYGRHGRDTGERIFPENHCAYPRSRGLSEHRAFSCEECCIPVHMQGWGDQWEEDFWPKMSAMGGHQRLCRRCEHDDCNIAVFKRTLLSILHSTREKNHLFGHKNRMVQPDSLNVVLTPYENISSQSERISLFDRQSKERSLCSSVTPSPPAASPRAAPAVQAARPQPPILSVRCGASRRPASGIQRWPAAGARRVGRPRARASAGRMAAGWHGVGGRGRWKRPSLNF
jgi:hypothetical protein